MKDKIEEEFKDKVMKLEMFELILEKNKSRLKKKQYTFLKNKLDDAWIHIWDMFHSDEENKLFHDTFKT